MMQFADGKDSKGFVPKIGLALGSGSARGLAHIGVLRAVEEAGIEIDFIAGTSMGALVGAVYAAGKLDELEAVFQSFDWKKTVAFFDVVLPKSGLLDGAKVSDLVREYVQSARIEELPKRFAAVATDIVSGEELTIASGDVIDAVRASISVPGVFTPIRSNGRILVDGGLVNPVPVGVARAMGADVVIAVDLNHEIVSGKNFKPVLPPGRLTERGDWVEGYRQAIQWIKERMLAHEIPGSAQLARWASVEEPAPNIFEVLLASINVMETRITQARLELEKPDILIQPPLGHIRFLQFARAEEIVEIGYRCAAEQLARWAETSTHG
ncbi:patatin-like phospholipase family protein [Stenotrophomonas maltophilia]|jgi:NTE family protein|uniref:Patatin n=1 Tax=Stenotrophomonas maltophilia TaxID=40324 RepID=A0A2J0UB21_STEMA|nr:patatin-like phospholipase family protein [Stenotrophomonas maltophilia]PJL28246.1 patatin [Stenotrophomonas maltophilia]WIM51760.1 patatin-like phospholipase family protein [Pseudomonas putida]